MGVGESLRLVLRSAQRSFGWLIPAIARRGLGFDGIGGAFDNRLSMATYDDMGSELPMRREKRSNRRSPPGLSVWLLFLLLFGSTAWASQEKCRGIGEGQGEEVEVELSALRARPSHWHKKEIVVTGYLRDLGAPHGANLCKFSRTEWDSCLGLDFDWERLGGRKLEVTRLLRRLVGQSVRIRGVFEVGVTKEEMEEGIFIAPRFGYLGEVSGVATTGEPMREFCLEAQRALLKEERFSDCYDETYFPGYSKVCLDPLGPVVWLDRDEQGGEPPFPIAFDIPEGYSFGNLRDFELLPLDTLAFLFGDALFVWQKGKCGKSNL